VRAIPRDRGFAKASAAPRRLDHLLGAVRRVKREFHLHLDLDL